MALIVIGIIGIVIGGLLWLSRSSNLAKIRQLETAEASSVADLEQVASATASEVGAGAFQRFVELRGVVECEQPLSSELTETECIYYRMSVNRSFEELAATATETEQAEQAQAVAAEQVGKPGFKPTAKAPAMEAQKVAPKAPVQPMVKQVGKGFEKPGMAPPIKASAMPPAKMAAKPEEKPLGKGFEKPAGKGLTKVPSTGPGKPSFAVDQAETGAVAATVRRSQNIASRTERCPFSLRDDTGVIEVLPDGAEIEAQQVLESFELEETMSGYDERQIAYGRFTFLRPDDEAENRTTLGYELQEWALPTGTEVYILGEVSDAEGRLMVHKPSDSSRKFIITTRSKVAVVQSLRSKVRGLAVGAFIALGVGGLLLLVGLIQKLAG